MDVGLLLKGLGEAAKSPLAFVAYVFVVLTWAAIVWKEARIKNLSKSLALLPEGKRLEALKLEYKLLPKNGLSPGEFLTHERRRYYFLAFGISIVALLLIATLAIYRYIELDKLNVAGETMRIAYQTFIRGTTTADDNRFKTAIGKMEESVIIKPTYSGFANLADIYEELGEVDRAIWASKKAAELDPSNPSPQNMLGALLKDKGQLDEAEQHLKIAQALFEKKAAKDDEFQVTLLVNAGNVHYERADTSSEKEAKQKHAKVAIDQFYEPALLLRGGLQNKRFLANLLGNIANSYRMIGDFKKAEQLMFQSIALKEVLAKSSPAWNSLGIGYFNFGDIYLKQGRVNDAKKYFQLSPRPKPTPKITSRTPAPCLKATCKPSLPSVATDGWRSLWLNFATSSTGLPSRASSSLIKVTTSFSRRATSMNRAAIAIAARSRSITPVKFRVPTFWRKATCSSP